MNKKLFQLLNDQYNFEIASALKYHDYAAQAESLGMENFKELLLKHHNEELTHAYKFYNYLLDRSELPFINANAHPGKIERFTDAVTISDRILKAEQDVTAKIRNIQKLATEVQDFETIEFNNWFLKEQIEEEKMCSDIIQAFKLSKDLLVVDRRIKEIFKSLEH